MRKEGRVHRQAPNINGTGDPSVLHLADRWASAIGDAAAERGSLISEKGPEDELFDVDGEESLFIVGSIGGLLACCRYDTYASAKFSIFTRKSIGCE